jgi:hypothetical protein
LPFEILARYGFFGDDLQGIGFSLGLEIYRLATGKIATLAGAIVSDMLHFRNVGAIIGLDSYVGHKVLSHIVIDQKANDTPSHGGEKYVIASLSYWNANVIYFFFGVHDFFFLRVNTNYQKSPALQGQGFDIDNIKRKN